MNTTCPFTKNIDCAENNKRKCENCGWNPDVAKERIRDWRAKQILEAENK